MTTTSSIIFALATSPGRSALHMHRISGQGCIDRLRQTLRLPGNRGQPRLKPRYAHYVEFVDSDGRVIDDVVLTAFLSPASYTGEDALEITSHGNPLISAALQARFRELGMVDARPGEFTHRAYLNGKLDLTRAEAIAQLVDAETWGALHVARQGCSGQLEAVARSLRERLIAARALLEAHIDFHEDEVGPLQWAELVSVMQPVISGLQKLSAGYARAKQLQKGLGISLLGLPNVGKSSLFNSLLRDDRAIVTDTAGTTRDVVKDQIVISGRDFVLADTAGIRTSDDRIESLGIERTYREARAPGVKIFVLAPDQTESLAEQARLLFGIPGIGSTGHCAFVVNKTDLLETSQLERGQIELREIAPIPVILVNQSEIEPLQDFLVQSYDKEMGTHTLCSGAAESSESYLLSQRQLDEVQRALSHISHAAQLAQECGLPEIIASEVIEAERALVDLLGRIDADEIFASIFSTFCVGK